MIISRALSLLAAAAAPFAAAAQSVECTLQRTTDSTYRGRCIAQRPTTLEVTLVSRAGRRPFEWRGHLLPPTGDAVPVTLAPPSNDFYATGVIEIPSAWLLLSGYQKSDRGLSFAFSWTAEAPATALDLAITRRAQAILADSALWDRADDRVCNPDDTSWSLYCALHRATVEIAGEFHHRQPALQIVRRVVGTRTPDRLRSHRLMDFNNHPDTRFAEIHDVLRSAAAAIEAALTHKP